MSLVQKIKNFWFGPAESYESQDFEDLFESTDEVYATNNPAIYEKPVSEVKPSRLMNPGSNSKVVDHPSAQGAASEVLVIEPRSFEEAVEIVEHLRGRKSVLINLHMLDNEQSQRVVDFLSGACHAIDGHQQRIGDGVFLFAPASVVITSESNSTRAIKDVFWNKS